MSTLRSFIIPKPRTIEPITDGLQKDRRALITAGACWEIDVRSAE